jgi:hypothetical protein
MHFRYYILGLLATFAFSLELNNKPDSFHLSNGRSLEDWNLEDIWDDSEEMWVIYVPNQACYYFISRVTKSDLRNVAPLLKRVFGGVTLNTGCWQPSRTYTLTPIAGLVVSTFLQPGGNADIGYTVSWAAENALNVAVNLIISFLSPGADDTTRVTMTIQPGAISPTRNWIFPEGASNFRLIAHDVWLAWGKDLKQD